MDRSRRDIEIDAIVRDDRAEPARHAARPETNRNGFHHLKTASIT
jgi:hypothetical protein